MADKSALYASEPEEELSIKVNCIIIDNKLTFYFEIHL